MLLNSSSSRKKSSYKKKSSKSWLSKKNSKKDNKYQEKSQVFISQFKMNHLNKSKTKDYNEKINENINFNNNNNYATNAYHFNLDKNQNNGEQNSTFVFTGDNASYVDYSKIIENYLKKPNTEPFFDCKSISTISFQEKDNFLVQKDSSFSLSSSRTKSTKAHNKNNAKLMQLLKQMNTLDNISVNNNLKKNEKKVEQKEVVEKSLKDDTKRKEKKIIIKLPKAKKDMKKKIMFVLFVFVNMIIYAFIIMKIFEPSVSSLFYDNDHNDYIYKTSLLSQDQSIVKNK